LQTGVSQPSNRQCLSFKGAVIVCRGNWHGDVAIKELNLDEESDSDNTSQLQAFKLEVSHVFYACCIFC